MEDAEIPGYIVSFRRRSSLKSEFTLKSLPETHISNPIKPDLGASKPFYNKLIMDPIDASLLDTDHFEFPTYFKIFLNVSYALFIVPFCVINDGSRFGGHNPELKPGVISSNIVQKTITAILQTCQILRAMVVASVVLNIKLQRSPAQIFIVIIILALLGFLTSIGYCVWGKQKSFRNLMSSFKITTNANSWKVREAAGSRIFSKLPVLRRIRVCLLFVLSRRYFDQSTANSRIAPGRAVPGYREVVAVK
ncbi:unnamed protein product [Orchesella dallaii]|uniref:Uncharacterized protein n=1 Tax=Orchesella dallaii TaxID=48710 RepID=A0ABP1R3C8_9HEXA